MAEKRYILDSIWADVTLRFDVFKLIWKHAQVFQSTRKYF